MKPIQLIQRWLKTLFLLVFIGIGSGLFTCAFATSLPPAVISYIQQKDAKATVRFDGVVLFSNGETYLPVIPQVMDAPEAVGVINTIPEKAPYPDLIQFDNNLFLVRLVQTTSGRLTLPKLEQYPIQMKEGLLPQDLVMPSNLFIPDELKIILGELPYTPKAIVDPLHTPLAQTLKATNDTSRPEPMALMVTYNMDDQLLVGINPVSGRVMAKYDLGCVPSAVQADPSGKYTYVSCFSANEVIVLDNGTGLIKTRIPVGEKPHGLLVLERSKRLVVSHRFSKFITLIDTDTLMPVAARTNSKDEASNEELSAPSRITLPGYPGAMANVTQDVILVADAFGQDIFQVNINSGEVEQTIKSLPDISALWVTAPMHQRPEVWVTSRSQNKLQVLDLADGLPLLTWDIAKKPVSMAGFEDNLYILCAGESKIEIVELGRKERLEPIQLQAGSFPNAMAIDIPSKTAFISDAAKAGVAMMDLSRHSIEKFLPVTFRTSLISYVSNTVSNVAGGALPILEKAEPKVLDTANPSPSGTSVLMQKNAMPKKTLPVPEPAKAPAEENPLPIQDAPVTLMQLDSRSAKDAKDMGKPPVLAPDIPLSAIDELQPSVPTGLQELDMPFKAD